MLSEELTRLVLSSRLVKCGFAVAMLIALFGELRTVLNRGDCFDVDFVVDKPTSEITTFPGRFVVEKNSIAPGELPGYTGWARPEKTLARYFLISSISARTTTNTGVERYEYVVAVNCKGHEDCVVVENERKSSNGKNYDSDSCSSFFFLRAYGPAVVPGIMTSRSSSAESCNYEFTFLFYDPGFYTVEAVLTVSKPPSISTFPLGKDPDQEEPHYEGYLLMGFPLTTTVVFEDRGKSEEQALCKFEDLVETSPMTAIEKARWKITGRVNEREYWSKTMNSSLVSTFGYTINVNSLGINMEYRYVNDCLLLEESTLDTNRHDKQPAILNSRCSGPPKKVHIVYIGDSVLRVQKDMLQKFLKGIPKDQVELTFLSLHGGYRKNQVMGPANVEGFLKELETKAKSEEVVLLFNTGLHDIHRLCGDEFKKERPSYLDKDRLDSGSFACVDEYRALFKDFVDLVKKFPAALKVFQTTTAAWPKYGNYGIGWGQGGQGMVLVSDFCQAFNEIAFEVLLEGNHKKDSNIDIMDGYWITYSRPDNREVGDIGNKLSHPGVEVLSAMTRKWVMLILDRVCLPI